MRVCNTRRSARSMRGDRKTPMPASAGISARFARFYVGLRIWVTGRPVFWRKGHVPKHGIGQRELHSCLWVLGLTSGYMGNNTFQCSFCLDVRQSEPCPLYTCVDMRINAP